MADNVELRDEDRLPWLETVEPDEPEGPPLGRVVAAVVLGLCVLALIVFGIFKLQQHRAGGDGQLIAAQEGDYKVKPDEPGGLKVNGEGDSAVATSAGRPGGTGAIDLKQVPEAPIAGKHAAVKATAPTSGGSKAVATVPATGGRLVAAVPAAAPTRQAGPAAAGSQVQLGAFPSEAAANAAWSGYTKRFGYLAGLTQSIQPVATNGRTLYRLRVIAGSAGQAADLCGRLKVAGESCFVAS